MDTVQDWLQDFNEESELEVEITNDTYTTNDLVLHPCVPPAKAQLIGHDFVANCDTRLDVMHHGYAVTRLRSVQNAIRFDHSCCVFIAESHRVGCWPFVDSHRLYDWTRRYILLHLQHDKMSTVRLIWLLVRILGYANKLLSSKLLIPFSRTTYCAYLIHPIIIRWVVMRRDSPVHLAEETIVSWILTFGFSNVSILSVHLSSPCRWLNSSRPQIVVLNPNI